MRIYAVEADGSERDAHYFQLGGNTKPDRFGKLEGYRCAPSGEGGNKSDISIFYRSIEDLADHLRSNPEWGVRVTMSDAGPSLRYDNIRIDGEPR